MGTRITTVRFQPDPTWDAAEVDWNFGRETDRFRAIPVVLDPVVERSVLDLCARLGVVFGCIDFVEDLEGNIFFLELNQMGQFLWIDHRMPHLGLVGKFCDLLLE